jgi:hypothetical protein
MINVGNLFGSNSLGTGTPLGTALPAPNILSKYASYNYVITLSALTIADYNYPDISYKAGKSLPIICKTGGASPDNRVATAYGKYDFYLDNLTMETIIGPMSRNTTSVSTLQFDVYEPYSIGVFLLALQTAAYAAGFQNWREAPFLLTIEFKGNTETGQITNIPFAARHIPIKLTMMNMKASETGCKYMINAYAPNGQAMTSQVANLKTDLSIKGKTVQEVLQTGEQSLQAVVNKNLKELAKSGSVSVPDEVVILFPKDTELASSSASIAGAGKISEFFAKSATVNTAAAAPADIYKKIGVSQNKLNQTLVQDAGALNNIGKSSLGFDASRRGDTSNSDETIVWDAEGKTWTRGRMTVNPAEGTLKFTQDMDIPSVIAQVLLTSDYPKTALATNSLDKDGMRTWFRIDTQVYYIDAKENLSATGSLPRIIVYRVVPYKAHSSKVTAPNSPAPGFKNIEKQVVKAYDYIYTGKNTEILKFNIDFSLSFANVMAADNYKKSGDITRAGATTLDKNKPANIVGAPKGVPPSKVPGSTTSQVTYSGTDTASDNQGGGGQETPATRAAKVWHDAFANPNDMLNLDMEIWGDPYWIAHSGQGNYTSKPVDGVKDLNLDGSVNWQTSEVHLAVNFRSPFDLNQITGFYDFKSSNMFLGTGNAKASPVIAFTGLYRITTVTSYFAGGQFRQALKGYRLPNQESKDKPDPSKTMSADQPAGGAATGFLDSR